MEITSNERFSNSPGSNNWVVRKLEGKFLITFLARIKNCLESRVKKDPAIHYYFFYVILLFFSLSGLFVC